MQGSGTIQLRKGKSHSSGELKAPWLWRGKNVHKRSGLNRRFRIQAGLQTKRYFGLGGNRRRVSNVRDSSWPSHKGKIDKAVQKLCTLLSQ